MAAAPAAGESFGDRCLPHVLGIASLLLLVAFLAFDDLPLVDLPQHAAQIAAWVRLDDPATGWAERFELNWRTPYLIANALARLLSPAFGVVVALKLVVWLAVVGNMFACHGLARRLGHDPFLALFGLITSCGLCFYFGFISYLFGAALGLFALGFALDHAEAPTPASGALLALTEALALLAHGVAFALATGLIGTVLLRGRGSPFARLAPLALPAGVALFWFLPGPVAQRIGGDAWDPSLLRWVDFPALLTSFGARDHFSVVLGLFLLVLTIASLGVRPVRMPERAMLVVALLAAYGLFPVMFRGIALLHTRAPAFLLPVLFLAVRPPALRPLARVRALRLGMLGVALVWFSVFAVRLAAFNRETADYHALIRELPEGLRMRPIIFDRETGAFPGVPAYLHYSAYYFVEKGGSQGYSFAMYPTSVVRYRPGVKPGMLNAAEWRPEAFDAAAELPVYDFFLVRSDQDRTSQLFENARGGVALRGRVGRWWGYEKIAPSAKQVLENVGRRL